MLGGGQLGRMFAMAARRLGYRVHTLAPEHDTPTGQIADVEVDASYDDMDRHPRVRQAVDVVTFEFENVSAAAVAEAAEAHAIVGRTAARSRSRSIGSARRRFSRARPAGRAVCAGPQRRAICRRRCRTVGCPAVLKTATFGYDGKGQVRIEAPHDLAAAWDALGRREAMLEASSISIARSR